MKNKRKLRPGSAKLSKLSSLQPRYKIDENVKNANNEKGTLQGNKRLIQMISNPKETKKMNAASEH